MTLTIGRLFTWHSMAFNGFHLVFYSKFTVHRPSVRLHNNILNALLSPVLFQVYQQQQLNNIASYAGHSERTICGIFETDDRK